MNHATSTVTEKASPSTLVRRLRAASGLIPIVIDDLQTSKITPEKAAMMAAFCQWAMQTQGDVTAEAEQHIAAIQEGLDQLRNLIG